MKLIVFDFDGTLINSSNLVLEAFKYAFKPFGIDADHNTIEKIRTRSTSELFDGFIEDHQKPHAFARLEDISSRQSRTCCFYPGVVEMLEMLKSRGYQLAIWTGRDTKSSLDILAINNLKHMFCAVVGNTSVEKNKPDPEGILKIIEELDADSRTTFMVGDHLHDIEGAKAAGVRSVLAKWGRPVECDRDYNADFVAKIPQEVVRYVESVEE